MSTAQLWENEVRTFVADLSPTQIFAAIALFEYCTYHYAPRLVGKYEEKRAGLGHLSSQLLVESYRQRLVETPEGRELCGGEDVTDEKLGRRLLVLLDQIDEWTMEIEGSLDDVDGLEANKDPKSEASRRARPKRTIRPDIFTDDVKLKRLIGISSPRVGVAPAPPPPPGNVIDVPASVSFYVAVSGETKGPFNGLELGAMVARGELVGTTMVMTRNREGSGRPPPHARR